jgi:jacalin-like lectin domain-containing protein
MKEGVLMNSGKALHLAAGLLLSGMTGAVADCGSDTIRAASHAPPRYVAGQQGPSGGSGGDYCHTNDVEPTKRLQSISVNSGATIDSIYLTFDDRGIKSDMLCGGTGGHPQVGQPPLILDPFEHIVRVSGRYGNTVDSLYIQTSNSQFRTFGVKDSNAPGTFDFIAPEGAAITALVIYFGG